MRTTTAWAMVMLSYCVASEDELTADALQHQLLPCFFESNNDDEALTIVFVHHDPSNCPC